MMFTLPMFGAALALASAVVYGAADFSGGLASRRNNPLNILAIVSLTSAILLVVLALLWRETLPSGTDFLWAAGAGLAGSLGMVTLYRGLSVGSAAVVSPTAGVIGAAVPVLFVALTEGLPNPLQLLGFVLAVLGIWLVTRSNSVAGPVNREALVLAVVSGITFGIFFLFIAHVEAKTPFAPMAVGKIIGFSVAGFLLIARRQPSLAIAGAPLAIAAGILDAAGNALYFLAQHITRLDIAVVLCSLYPVSTVVLAYMVLRQHISRIQAVGVVICLLAIALIVL